MVMNVLTAAFFASQFKAREDLNLELVKKIK